MSAGLAFYLRLSMADGDLGKDNKDESNSIENQRELLQSFVESKEEFTDEIFEYIDDGYTGTNFNRPAFRRMIEDAKKGRIHTILVKDLSRLGRDYIGVGDYLEQYLDNREFNPELVHELVERVSISNTDGYEITFKCEDVYKKVIEMMEGGECE